MIYTSNKILVTDNSASAFGCVNLIILLLLLKLPRH